MLTSAIKAVRTLIRRDWSTGIARLYDAFGGASAGSRDPTLNGAWIFPASSIDYYKSPRHAKRLGRHDECSNSLTEAVHGPETGDVSNIPPKSSFGAAITNILKNMTSLFCVQHRTECQTLHLTSVQLRSQKEGHCLPATPL